MDAAALNFDAIEPLAQLDGKLGGDPPDAAALLGVQKLDIHNIQTLDKSSFDMAGLAPV